MSRRLVISAVPRLIALVVAGALAVPGFVAFRVWYIARQDQRPPSDAIVVLGAAQFDGRPSAVFQARLAHAADLFREGVAHHVVTVGGSQPGDRFTEAGSAQRWLASAQGLPSERIVAVPGGRNTLQSLRLVQAAVTRRGWNSVVIVTDPWHSMRSATMARDLGLAAATSPTRTGPIVLTRETEVRYIARETVAFLHYEYLRSRGEARLRAPERVPQTAS